MSQWTHKSAPILHLLLNSIMDHPLNVVQWSNYILYIVTL